MLLQFPEGIKVNFSNIFCTEYCWACGRQFGPGDTVSIGANGNFAFRWIHKKCEEKTLSE